MSYGPAPDLQQAIYAALTGDAELTSLSGGAVFDAMPEGKPEDCFILIGDEEVRDRSDVSGFGADFLVAISVIGPSDGFLKIKQIAARVSDLLLNFNPSLARGCIGFSHLDRVRARRSTPQTHRRVDLRFRMRVDDITPSN
ncbi:MAG: DUF3168 domain-containing protein [Pseudomonadota bacterium]